MLCDGPCNRAYHFLCVRPPLREADLSEDDGWLCPGCDTKVRTPKQAHASITPTTCQLAASPGR